MGSGASAGASGHEAKPRRHPRAPVPLRGGRRAVQVGWRHGVVVANGGLGVGFDEGGRSVDAGDREAARRLVVADLALTLDPIYPNGPIVRVHLRAFLAVGRRGISRRPPLHPVRGGVPPGLPRGVADLPVQGALGSCDVMAVPASRCELVARLPWLHNGPTLCAREVHVKIRASVLAAVLIAASTAFPAQAQLP